MSATPGFSRAELAHIVATAIPEGWYVNLGIGLPTLVANHIPPDREVVLHSENGLLGMGPAPGEDAIDPWLINAGKQHVTLRDGGAFFHQADSFAMIRGRHLDLCVLGAFEVAANGDLANWATSATDAAPAVGGAMDLAVGAGRIWVMMEHTTRDGRPKLVERCAYPLTAPAVVRRVFTNLAVLDIDETGFALRRLAPGVSFDDLQNRTAAQVRRDAAGKDLLDG